MRKLTNCPFNCEYMNFRNMMSPAIIVLLCLKLSITKIKKDYLRWFISVVKQNVHEKFMTCEADVVIWIVAKKFVLHREKVFWDYKFIITLA